MKKFWKAWFWVLKKELKWMFLTWGTCVSVSWIFDWIRTHNLKYAWKDMIRRLYPRWMYEQVFCIDNGIEAEEEGA